MHTYVFTVFDAHLCNVFTVFDVRLRLHCFLCTLMQRLHCFWCILTSSLFLMHTYATSSLFLMYTYVMSACTVLWCIHWYWSACRILSAEAWISLMEIYITSYIFPHIHSLICIPLCIFPHVYSLIYIYFLIYIPSCIFPHVYTHWTMVGCLILISALRALMHTLVLNCLQNVISRGMELSPEEILKYALDNGCMRAFIVCTFSINVRIHNVCTVHWCTHWYWTACRMLSAEEWNYLMMDTMQVNAVVGVVESVCTFASAGANWPATYRAYTICVSAGMNSSLVGLAKAI